MLEVKGLDAFEKTLLNTIEVKFPRKIRKQIIKLANELRKEVRSRTPKGDKEYYYYKGTKTKITSKKRLKNRWKVGKLWKKNGEYFIQVYNSAPHAHLIEYGHRTPNGGFVQGQHMLMISTKKIEKRLEPELKNWLDRMLKELEL